MKRGHIIAKDLKAVEGMVPQLKRGYVKWSNGMKDAAHCMSWSEALMDITQDYDLENEDDGDEMNRTVAWLVLTRTTEGFEDLIEEEVQSGKKGFHSCF
jgi:hypothetical protein